MRREEKGSLEKARERRRENLGEGVRSNLALPKMPISLAIASAVGCVSPVIMTTRMPAVTHSLIAGATSGCGERGKRKRGEQV